jgi:mono/diheme cytochrome c family protein
MFKRIVDVVEVVAAACAVIFVVLLFIEKPPGTKAPAAGASTPQVTVETGTGGSAEATVPAISGAAVYASNCAQCHGADATGGIGPRLAGVVTKAFPDKRVQIIVVTQGTGAMPPFGGRLSAAEIKAVVDYTRSLK